MGNAKSRSFGSGSGKGSGKGSASVSASGSDSASESDACNAVKAADEAPQSRAETCRAEPCRSEPCPIHADPFSKEAVEARRARASRIARKTLEDEARREADRGRDEALRSRDEAVGRIVDGFMANGAINSAFVPDFVERAIYRNVLTLGLALLEEMISESRIEVLGHRLEMRLAPKPAV